MKTNRSHNAHFLCFDGLNPLQDKHGIKTIHFGGRIVPFIMRAGRYYDICEG